MQFVNLISSTYSNFVAYKQSKFFNEVVKIKWQKSLTNYLKVDLKQKISNLLN